MSAFEKEDRIWYFDFLRIFACVSVIFLHVSAQYLDKAAVGTYDWMICNIYDSLSRWAVPVFVMISGALFLDSGKPFEIQVMLKKNLLRLATAFLFWSFLYAFFEFLQGVRLRDVVFDFFSGGIHLWFLYMIGGLYLLVPLLRKLTASEKAMNYFLFLWFLLSVLFCTVKAVAANINAQYVALLDKLTDEFGLHFVYGYSGYFVLGYYLHHFDFPRRARNMICSLGVFGASSTIMATYLFSKRANVFVDSFYGYFSLGVFFAAVAFFMFFKYHVQIIKKDVSKRIVRTVSKCSFGIYLVHFLFVKYNSEIFRLDMFSLNPIFSIPLSVVIVFVCSLFVSWVLNYIPITKKYLV